jgi:hypothetical protein
VGLVSLWSVQAAIAFASLLITPALPLIARANRLHAAETPTVEPAPAD